MNSNFWRTLSNRLTGCLGHFVQNTHKYAPQSRSFKDFHSREKERQPALEINHNRLFLFFLPENFLQEVCFQEAYF